MSRTVTKIAAVAFVFISGYYFGGGCDPKATSQPTSYRIGDRVDDLEKRVYRGTEKAKIDGERVWGDIVERSAAATSYIGNKLIEQDERIYEGGDENGR